MNGKARGYIFFKDSNLNAEFKFLVLNPFISAFIFIFLFFQNTLEYIINFIDWTLNKINDKSKKKKKTGPDQMYYAHKKHVYYVFIFH